jgi:microsomal dipeptidase-like Zn-dependent dipeptidase
MRFFDAHCDTIGKIWEGKADFVTGAISGDDGAAGRHGASGHGASALGAAGHGAADGGPPGASDPMLHVTLPGLRTAGVRAQVFASWVWSTAYPGREMETGLGKVDAVRRLCADYPEDLFPALTGADIAEACALPEQGAAPQPEAAQDVLAAHSTGAEPDRRRPRTAVIASLEGADPLLGDVDNLDLFYRAGVRLITLAWGDNAFCGSVFGQAGGLTAGGATLVAACEEKGVLVDVSHASDQAFADICGVASRPFVASHSNCRSLCPSPRNLTDQMIRAVGERGGVMGVCVVPAFLSAEYHARSLPANQAFWRAVAGGTPFEEAGRNIAASEALIPRPPLRLVAEHVRHAINIGGEDAVGLGGDLDGVDNLPAGLEGVADYPQIADLLIESGLTAAQVEKVCYRNLARVFRETVA